MFSAIHGRLEKTARYGARAGGAAIMLVAFMITADVLTRKFSPIKLSNIPEISGYLFVVGIAWAYSLTFLQRRHIRIDTLYVLMPTKMRALLDVLSALMMLVVVSIVVVYCFDVFHTSWVSNSRSISTLGAPLWIPQLFWFLGLTLFLLTCGFVFLYSLISLLRGDWLQVTRLSGLPSVKEEIDSEVGNERS